MFVNSHFIQIKGTAMGTKFAPTYANLVIGYFEFVLYIKLHSSFDSNFIRYLDDCFIIWKFCIDMLNQLLHIMNNINSSIQFTMEFNDNALPFLDILVKIDNGVISTDIFHKPTDSKLYLPFNSSHPKHTRSNITFSLARRLLINISDHSVFTSRLKELKSYLLKQNYPQKLISDAFLKVTNLDRRQILQEPSKIRKPVIPFITIYNPHNPNIFKHIRNSLPILQTDPKFTSNLQNSNITKCYRQPKNLKQLLCSSTFPECSSKPCVSKCDTPRCQLCEIIICKDIFISENRKNFHVKCNMNCNSLFVVYVLFCANCNATYIGGTNNLRLRVNLHRNHIENPNYGLLFVSQHIQHCSSNIAIKFKVIPIYKCPNDDVIYWKN